MHFDNLGLLRTLLCNVINRERFKKQAGVTHYHLKNADKQKRATQPLPLTLRAHSGTHSTVLKAKMIYSASVREAGQLAQQCATAEMPPQKHITEVQPMKGLHGTDPFKPDKSLAKA